MVAFKILCILFTIMYMIVLTKAIPITYNKQEKLSGSVPISSPHLSKHEIFSTIAIQQPYKNSYEPNNFGLELKKNISKESQHNKHLNIKQKSLIDPSSEESKLDNITERNDRINFQIHGYNGSYKFGFDTGTGKNRQFRFEERDDEGNVFGKYGYLDDKGKINIIKYTSKANGGFLSEKVV